MALRHYQYPPKLPSSSSERSLLLPPSFSLRNHATNVFFRPATNGIVLRGALNKDLLMVRGSKFDQDFDLEGEIFEFMKNSRKPNMFPSREELVAAGRVDLVNAILDEGGWLSAGWDSKEKSEEGEEEKILKINGSNSYVFKDSDVSLRPEFREATPMASHPSPSLSTSSSAQSHETNHGHGGIEGMLSRLEKERAASSAIECREKENTRSRREEMRAGTGYSWESLTKMYGDKSWDSSAAVNEDRERTLLLSPSTSGVSFDGSEKQFSLDLLDDDFGGSSQAGGLKSLQEDYHVTDSGVSGSNAELIIPTGSLRNGGGISSNPRIDESDTKDEISMDNEENRHQNYEDDIRTRIWELETKLSSMIRLLRLGTSDHKWNEESDNSLEKLHELSDAWEFQETEIMKSRAKLRSIHAKLAILEGKMALEIMEAQRLTEEKLKQIEKAERALGLLRTACIVWSGSGKDVLLAGSFDGWTSQAKIGEHKRIVAFLISPITCDSGKRPLERTSSGAFSVRLKLYPGRYELKFIVDGVWRTDPLRPIVNNNGYENNLLIIS